MPSPSSSLLSSLGTRGQLSIRFPQKSSSSSKMAPISLLCTNGLGSQLLGSPSSSSSAPGWYSSPRGSQPESLSKGQGSRPFSMPSPSASRWGTAAAMEL